MRFIRRLVSLIGILLLVGGLYLAIKGLSGIDPLKFSGKEVSNYLSSRGKQVLGTSIIASLGEQPNSTKTPTSPKRQVYLTLGLVADSHLDSANLTKALAQIKSRHVDAVIALGDYSNVGTIEELTNAKRIFDQSGLLFYALPGDHDFWDNKNRAENAATNFSAVFGQPYQQLTLKGMNFTLIDNADNDLGMTVAEQVWLKQVLVNLQPYQRPCPKKHPLGQICGLPNFVFVHEPLYHPTTDHIMGRLVPVVDQQRKDLLQLFKADGVTEVISGDLHFFSRYMEPTLDLPMTTIGAVTSDRNLQTPRYALLTIYTDGTYAIDDKEIVQ